MSKSKTKTNKLVAQDVKERLLSTGGFGATVNNSYQSRMTATEKKTAHGLNVSIRGLSTNILIQETDPIASQAQYVFDKSSTTGYYAYPLQLYSNTLMPPGLRNKIAVYSKARINALRIHYIPEVGTGLVVNSAAAQVNPGRIAIALCSSSDFPQPSDGSETTVTSLTYATVSGYPVSIACPPGLPASSSWWRRGPTDGYFSPCAGYDSLPAGPLSVQASGDLSITAFAELGASMTGIPLGTICLDIDIELLYPRGISFIYNALVGKPDGCLACRGETKICGACGGKDKHLVFPGPALLAARKLALLKLSREIYSDSLADSSSYELLSAPPKQEGKTGEVIPPKPVGGASIASTPSSRYFK